MGAGVHLVHERLGGVDQFGPGALLVQQVRFSGDVGADFVRRALHPLLELGQVRVGDPGPAARLARYGSNPASRLATQAATV